MRSIVFAALLALAQIAGAQPALKVTQLAEFADELAQAHAAALDQAGRLLEIDTCNDRIVLLRVDQAVH